MYVKAEKIRLLNTDLLATMNLYKNDVFEKGLVKHKKGDMQDIQEVLEVSEYAKSRGINVGDKIYVNLEKYIKLVPSHNYDSSIQRTQAPDGKKMDRVFDPPYIKLGDEVYFHPDYSDIDYVVTEWEELEETGLVVPDEKKIII